MTIDAVSGERPPVDAKRVDTKRKDPPAQSLAKGGSTGDSGNQDIPPGPENRVRMARLAETFNEGYAKTPYAGIIVSILARLGEFIIVGATGLSIYTIYLLPVLGVQSFYMITIATVAAIVVMVFQALRIYTTPAFRNPIATMLKLTSGWILVFLVAMAGIFFLKKGIEFSRLWLFGWFVFGWLALAANRMLFYLIVKQLIRRGQLDVRAVIVGGGPAAERLLHELGQQKNSNIKIFGVFDDRSDYRTPDVLGGYPKLGNVDDLVKFAVIRAWT